MVFGGDYSQLEPVRRDPVYKGDECAQFHSALNCYIELDGRWRFIDDERWGDKMNRFRHGNLTEEDIKEINSSCHVAVRDEIPAGVQIATHKNKDRDAINASIFHNVCTKNRQTGQSKITEEAIVIFMDELLLNDSKSAFVPVMSNTVKKYFYEHCSESSCNHGGRRTGRIDPTLKLHPSCPMMLTKNSDVANDGANGSQVFMRNVNMKRGEQSFHLEIDNGSTILAAFASQVRSLVVEHEIADITSRVFEVG